MVALAVGGCGTNEGGTNSDTNGDVAPGGGAPPAAGGSSVLLRASHGSTIDISTDDARLVVANRDFGTVSVFSVDHATERPTLTKIGEVEVGGEPFQVVLHPSGDSAFVVTRRDQKLVRIDGIRQGTPTKARDVAVGSEPTGIALTPTGKTVWVANWVDGTVQAIDTAEMTVRETIDLNATLAASGLLGAGIAPRAALAHPRSIAITNNGDAIETDEAMYVTEYFAQQKAPLAADGANADVNRVGIVYKIPLETKQPQIIELPALADMGFRDHDDAVTGCFPNQLQSIHIQGAFGYVMSVCASPKGPLGVFTGPPNATCSDDAACPGARAGSCAAGRCATNCTEDVQCGKLGGRCVDNVCAPNPVSVRSISAPVVSILDLGAGSTLATVNLNKEWINLYDELGTPDTTQRRLPLHVMDIGFVPGTVTAYLPANGADAVFRVDFNATYESSTVDAVGTRNKPFIDLAPPGADPARAGRTPTGITVGHKLHKGNDGPRYAYVTSEATWNVQVIDLAAQEVAGASVGQPLSVPSTAAPSPERAFVLEGKELFNTGLGRWSFKGQGWGACQTCHVDGLTDGVTWFFARGPRQSPSLDGTVNSKDPSDQRVLNWTAMFDELSDFEIGALRGALGGVGAIVSQKSTQNDARIPFDRLGHAGLNGSSMAAADPKNPANLPNACVVDDWAKIAAFLRTVRSPRKPTSLDAAKVERGRTVFRNANCQGCHGGGKWTVSTMFYEPDPAGNRNRALVNGGRSSWTGLVNSSGFPTALLPTLEPSLQKMRYAGTNAAALDQITCVLRNVGTYNVAEPEVGIAEVRQNMKAAAQGNEPEGRGYNPPSLLNVVAGAPYLHAGGARTLEALFSERFESHHAALSSGFLTGGTAPSDREALVQFLLSIDEDAETIAIPELGPRGGSFCASPQ
jgi:DNA-binding beta-propeller fold protein YncE